MTFPRSLAIAACAAILALSGPALAKSDKSQKGDKGGGKPAVTDTKSSHGKTDSTTDAVTAIGAAVAGALLSDQDRTTISRYFQQHPQPASSLPPGIAKNLARGKPLPPGIAKRGVPNALSGQLKIPSGYELQTVGTDVVLIQAGTQIIADVLKDVLRK